MKSISTMVEGLLDDDFDIKDEDIRVQIIISNLNKFWHGSRPVYGGYQVMGHMLACKESELLTNIHPINSPAYVSDKLESKINEGDCVMILRSHNQQVAVQFVWKDKNHINVYPGITTSSRGLEFKNLLEYKNWITGNVKGGIRIWLTQKCISLTQEDGKAIIQYFINKK